MVKALDTKKIHYMQLTLTYSAYQMYNNPEIDISLHEKVFAWQNQRLEIYRLFVSTVNHVESIMSTK